MKVIWKSAVQRLLCDETGTKGSELAPDKKPAFGDGISNGEKFLIVRLIRQGGVNRSDGDGVKLGVILRQCFDGSVAVTKVFLNELGEEMRLVHAIELRAKAKKTDGEFARLRSTALDPMAGECETVVDEVTGFAGERVLIGAWRDEKLAKSVAEGAARFECKIGVDEIGAFVRCRELKGDLRVAASVGGASKIEENGCAV